MQVIWQLDRRLLGRAGVALDAIGVALRRCGL
jgi:hypothetical protein